MPELTVHRARELLNYSSETGAFVWRVARSRFQAGKIAGSMRKDGYRQIMIDWKHVLAHRLAWLIIYGEWPHRDIDHVDGNPGNNAINNLRLATESQNNANSRLRKDNSSGFKGVSYHRRNRKWHARIKINGKTKHLGSFSSKEGAAIAYQIAAKEHFGEFARAE